MAPYSGDSSNLFSSMYWSFSCISALIGATPAPVPTKIIGPWGFTGNLKIDSTRETLRVDYPYFWWSLLKKSDATPDLMVSFYLSVSALTMRWILLGYFLLLEAIVYILGLNGYISSIAFSKGNFSMMYSSRTVRKLWFLSRIFSSNCSLPSKESKTISFYLVGQYLESS